MSADPIPSSPLSSRQSLHQSPGKRNLYYGWIVVVTCLTIGMVGFGLRFSFGVFFKPLATDFGLNRTTTSGIMSLYMLLNAVVAIVGGWLLDRYGPRKVVAVMGFLTGLSLLLASQASALWHLYLSYSLLLAIATGAIYTAMVATASRWFIKRRGLIVAIVTSALGVGLVITPVPAYLISSYGWRMSYFILALAGFFIILPLSLLLRVPSREVIAPHEGETPEAIHLNHGQRHFSLLEATKTRNFWLIFSLWLSNAFCIFIIIAHIVPHAIDLGIATTTAATILSLIGGVSILGRVVMGRISDSIGRKKTAIISTLLTAGAMLWLIWSLDLWSLYLFAVVFGFSWGGVNISLAALVADIFGLQRLGVMVGIMDAGFGIGGALGPVFAGYIFDVKGSYVFAFLGGLLVMLVAAGLVLLLRMPPTGKEGYLASESKS